jgi:hypothetical protein
MGQTLSMINILFAVHYYFGKKNRWILLKDGQSKGNMQPKIKMVSDEEKRDAFRILWPLRFT